MEKALLDIEKSNIEFTDVSLEKIFITALNKTLGSALWRNPEEEEIHIIISLSESQPETIHPVLEELTAGFLISPYENDNNLLQYFIKADLHFVLMENDIKLFGPAQSVSDKQINKFIQSAIIEQENNFQLKRQGQEKNQHVLSKDKFEDLIKLSIEKINQGVFHKVVPSRLEEIDLPDDFNIVSKFINLCNIHPKAFVSLFYLPKKGIWLGASPELLVKITDKKLFFTSAVAGTKSGKDVSSLSEVAWTQKEIEEQAFVSRYIINCFKKIRLREFEEYGPRTVKAGSLLHLRTDYKVDLEAVNFPQLGSVMLKLLHPTSAVCGMPKEPALSFLVENEKIDRKFYSGYLGPVNLESDSSLYVNLRCARIEGKKAILYAGAGVTRDSIPEREWRETELKMNTIREVLLS